MCSFLSGDSSSKRPSHSGGSTVQTGGGGTSQCRESCCGRSFCPQRCVLGSSCLRAVCKSQEHNSSFCPLLCREGCVVPGFNPFPVLLEPETKEMVSGSVVGVCLALTRPKIASQHCPLPQGLFFNALQSLTNTF